MIFNQRANLLGDFGTIKSHHEQLSHGPIFRSDIRSNLKDCAAAQYLSILSHTGAGESMTSRGVCSLLVLVKVQLSSNSDYD